jgi:hypothetical protein
MTAFWANRVIVKDESILSMATLLKPAIFDLGNRGNAAKTQTICEVLEGKELIYTVLSYKNNRELFHLELRADEKFRKMRAFPEGTYD